MKQPFLTLLMAAVSLACSNRSAPAEVTLPPALFSDHMVLQRDRPLPVWGWATPGEAVVVNLGNAVVTTKADSAGNWRTLLPPRPASSTPLELRIRGKNEVRFTDVVVGEVWLCSGQSNMEWDVAHCNNAEQEIAAGNFPLIRHLKVYHTATATPEQKLNAKAWEPASPKTVGEFTAAGYYFAREVQRHLGDVPIGLIGASRAGAAIEPWINPEGYQQVPALREIAGKLSEYPAKNPQGEIDYQSPLALYNGMIRPLVPYAIRGVLWYQGEQNRMEGMIYRDKMQALIQGWRTVWKQEDFPFYYAQVAPYRHKGDDILLAGFWEAQAAAMTIPNTGMIVTVDISELDEIHPPNKQDVGKRLALWALAKTYGKSDLVYSGPLYESMTVEGSAIRLRFKHVGPGLVARDGKPLNWFTIAGADRKFRKATATINGETILVSAPDVTEPVAVRFGWNQIAEPNLSNRAGLPAAPFRTDTWTDAENPAP